jgi:HAD superfamily hydrolase (TIGR01509 family)|tara:strand:+ start:120 stop:764 length:645 start_codon:yes stop_codon:yes gene_type:complete
MIKGVIFDMDGTIVDSLPFHYKAWKIFFNENKVENFSEKLKDYKGGGTLDLMNAVYGDKYSRKKLKIMTDDKEIIFREIYKNNVVPIMGFMEMFELIKSKNILVGIASNAIRKNVEMILSELKIYEKFDSIICGDEVKKGKPDPEMFNETVKRFNLKKEECLIFEDSVEGILAAVNSKVDVVGITSSTSKKVLSNKGCKITIDNYLNFDMSIYG